jgi:hypothetical protein
VFLELLWTTISFSHFDINDKKKHVILFLYTCTLFLAKDPLYCLFMVVKNTCQRRKSEYVIQSVQQWLMDKIDPSRSMNGLVLPRKVPEPSSLHMNKGA